MCCVGSDSLLKSCTSLDVLIGSEGGKWRRWNRVSLQHSRPARVKVGVGQNCTIYKEPGFLAVVWFGSAPTPFPSPSPSRRATHMKTEKERQLADRRGGWKGRGLARIRILRPQSSLVLCKSFNTLWCGQRKVYLVKTSRTSLPMKSFLIKRNLQ